MKYFANYCDGFLTHVSTEYGEIEIPEEKYTQLRSELWSKGSLTEALYAAVITISDIPTEWQEEIQRRVDERIAMQGALEEQDISAEEALNIILGGEVE